MNLCFPPSGNTNNHSSGDNLPGYSKQIHFILLLHQFATIHSSVLWFIACCFTGASPIAILMLWLLKMTTMEKTVSCSPTFLGCLAVLLPAYNTRKRFEGMDSLSQSILF